MENRARALTGEERLKLRNQLSAPVVEKLNQYLLRIRDEVLPKSRFLIDGDLEIDNGANRDIAIGRGTRTFFGSDAGATAQLERPGPGPNPA